MSKPTEQLATEVRKGHDLREPAVATMARALVNERGEVILDLIANKQAAAKLAELQSGLLATASEVQAELNLKADDNDVVKLTGAQAIAGVKTFLDNIVVEKDLVTSGTSGYAVTSLLCSGDTDLTNLPIFADNAAAAALPAGRIYRTATGEIRIKY